jgi:hypothetical protein
MSIVQNDRGSISIFRIGLIMAGLGLLVVIGGFVLLEFERAEKRSALEITPPAGAEVRFNQPIGQNGRRVVYQVNGDDDDTVRGVVEYYQARMDSFYDTNARDADRQLCRRSPSGQGTFQDYEPGNGLIPYEYRCEFDDSSDFGGERRTIVRIYPGVLDEESGLTTEGLTLIDYDMAWSG